MLRFNKNIFLFRYALVLLIITGGGGILTPGFAWAKGLKVVKMVLADPKISPNKKQLVQVSLRNYTKKPIKAGIRVEVLFGLDQPTGVLEDRVIMVPPHAAKLFKFSLKVPYVPGRYTAVLSLFEADFKELKKGANTPQQAAFLISGTAADTKTEGKKEEATDFKPPAGLSFEAPDLLWENFNPGHPSLLLGDQLKVKAMLRNVGGDIAKEVQVQLAYIYTRIPSRVVPIASATVPAMAPGEKREMEFNYPFPDNSLLGQYKIVLTVDSQNSVRESNETNNKQVSDPPIRLASIRQIFPEPGYTFDESGLFLFRWDSKKFTEFKVQVGTDPTFQSEANFFDIPQGVKWTTEKEVVPLSGELPFMAKGLMIKNKTDKIYWRVTGRQPGTDKRGYSLVLPFKVRLEEEPPPGPKK